MSDERLRELERTWRESGADGDERAYLAERVRRGDLGAGAVEVMEAVWSGAVTRADLEVLAYAGDRLAFGLVGERLVELAEWKAANAAHGAPTLEWDDIANWAFGLSHWGERGVVLGLSALIEHRANTLFEERPPPTGDEADVLFDVEADAVGGRNAVAAVRACLAEIDGGAPSGEVTLWTEDYGGYSGMVSASQSVLHLAQTGIWAGALVFVLHASNIYDEIGLGRGDAGTCFEALPGLLRRRILGAELAARLEESP